MLYTNTDSHADAHTDTHTDAYADAHADANTVKTDQIRFYLLFFFR